MEKLNKHGLPIMNTAVKSKSKKVDKDSFCHGLNSMKCYRIAKHRHGPYGYCEVCYLVLLDRQFYEL